MPPAIQKFTLDWFMQKCPPDLAAVVILTGLLLWLALRINRVISHAYDQEAQQTARLDVLEKQLGKTIALICRCPRVSKKNGMWLQNPAKNGGEPPDEIEEG